LGQRAAIPSALLSGLPPSSGSVSAGPHQYSLSLSPDALALIQNPDSLHLSLRHSASGKELVISAPITIYSVPQLFFAAATGNLVLADLYPRKSGSPAVIRIPTGDDMSAKWTCTDYPGGALSSNASDPNYCYSNDIFGCGRNNNGTYNYTFEHLYFSGGGEYTAVAGPSGVVAFGEVISCPGEGRYFATIKTSDGCIVPTDTVMVKPPVVPTLTINTDCNTGLDVLATVDGDDVPTEWEWIIRSTPQSEDPSEHNGYGFTLKDGESIAVSHIYSEIMKMIFVDDALGVGFTEGDWGDLTPTYSATKSGASSSLSLIYSKEVINVLTSITSSSGLDFTQYPWYPLSMNGLPSTLDDATRVWGDVDALTHGGVLAGSFVFARCKINGEWSEWAGQQLGMTAGSAFDEFHFGISATPCIGSDNKLADFGLSGYCAQTDTVVKEGSPVQFRIWMDGFVTIAKIEISNGIENIKTEKIDASVSMNLSAHDIVIYWQYYDKTAGLWTTWASSDYSTVSQVDENGIAWVNSPIRYINDETQTGRYRAVFSVNGCAIASTDAQEGGFKGDEGKDAIMGEEDAGHYDDEVEVSFKLRPSAPVPNPTELCLGVDPLTLTWNDIFVPSTMKLQYRLGTGSWLNMTGGANDDYMFAAADGKTVFTVYKTFFVTGSYTFRIVDEGVEGDASKAVTVEDCTYPAPEPDENSYCEDAEDGVLLIWSQTFNAATQSLLCYPSTGSAWVEVSTICTFTPLTVSGMQVFSLVGLPVGSYTFKVVDKDGSLDGKVSTSVTVNAVPTISVNDFSILSGTDDVTDGRICPGQGVVLEADYEAGATYTWYYTDGTNVGAGASLEFVDAMPANMAGTFNFVLLVQKTQNGCSSESEVGPHSLIVDPAPTQPVISVAAATICAGTDHTFEPTVTPATATPDGTYTYTWTAGGSTVGTTKNLTVSPSATTTYTFKVDVATSHGCTDSKSANVTLTVNPAPSITDAKVTGTTTLCASDALSLTASATGTGLSYKWYHAASSAITDATATVATTATFSKAAPLAAADAGTYTVRITSTSGSGATACTTTHDEEVTVTVNPLPVNPVITQPSAGLTLCTGSTDKLTATVSGNNQSGVTYTYKWYTGSTVVKTSTDATNGLVLNFAPSGGDVSTGSAFTRNYYLVIESEVTATGCKNTTATVTGVAVKVEVCGDDAIDGPYEVCPTETTPKAFTLSVASPAPSSVTWQQSTDQTNWTAAVGTNSCSATVGSSCTFTPSAIPAAGNTVYYRAVIVRNGSTFYKETSYTTYPEPTKPVVTATADPASVCAGGSIALKASNTSATGHTYANWKWTGPGSYSSTSQNPTLSNLQTSASGEYSVTVEATSADGCKVTSDAGKVTVTVNPAATKPVITIAAATVCAGTGHTFEPTVTPATATPDGTYTYTWTAGGST
ncbi:MAG: hypothetical protein K2O66_08105, partial [Bacteroidales bacterium]|nr:hypothetical protein [Bacteroidales bacterium]